MLQAHLPHRILIGAIACLTALFGMACESPSPSASNQEALTDSLRIVPPYQFTQGASRFDLPKRLREISGLTILSDALLGAVQDEEGLIFVIDMDSGTTVAEYRFGKDGDYEDLALVGDMLYVVRSDGTLYGIRYWQTDSLTTHVYKTPLSKACDAEGLAFDEPRNQLLIACKEYILNGSSKTIFAFDILQETLRPDPAHVLSLVEIEKLLRTSNTLNDRIQIALGPIFNTLRFKPSALAFHPVTNELYVLSANPQALVVLSQTGQLVDAWLLPKDLFEQPEGLAFLPNGDLFIASEGSSSPATIMRFRYQPHEQSDILQGVSQ